MTRNIHRRTALALGLAAGVLAAPMLVRPGGGAFRHLRLEHDPFDGRLPFFSWFARAVQSTLLE